MRIGAREFHARPLRVHALLHDVPLEDARAVPLSGGGAGRTIQDLRAVMVAGREAAPALVQGLFRLRGHIGILFGWDHQRPAWNAESYADRLSPADRAQSQAPPGTPDGKFSLLYRFEDEQLSELRNATVHAFASLSIRQTPGGYLAYVGVFVAGDRASIARRARTRCWPLEGPDFPAEGTEGARSSAGATPAPR